MSTQVQFRRGTTAQHSTFTGAVGECTVDTDKDTLVIHDGATAGGFPLERAPSSSTDNGVPRFDGTTGAILQTSAAIVDDAGLLTTTSLALTANSNQVVLDSDGTYTTTLTASASTSSKTITFPNTTGTVALTADKLSAFSATTSAELAGVISDETGSGALVFATSPTLVTPTLGVATGTSLSLTANSNQIVLDSDDGSGFTTTITDSATAARVLTLPDLTTTLVGSDASSVTDGGLVVWDGTTGKKVKAVATTTLTAVENNFLVGNATPAWSVKTPAEARDALGLPTTAESTDDALVKFNGTAGEMQNSTATLTDAGLLTTVSLALTGDSNQLVLDSDGTYTTTITAAASGSSKTITLPNTTGTVALTGDKLSAFAATTSAELAGVISDETGSGVLVFATSPTLTTPNIGVATGTTLSLTADSNQLVLNSDGTYTTTLTATAGTSSKTITFPNATGEIVLKDTTDILQNKTLTTPKFADLGYIADANGEEMLQFDTVSTATCWIRIANAANGTLAPVISAQGDGANVDLTLNSKGSGEVYADGGVVLTSAGNQLDTLLSEKTSVASNDRFLMEDSADSDTKKYVVWSNMAASLGAATGTSLNLTADSNQIVLDSNGTYTMTLTGGATTSNKTITFPNATGTVVLKDTTDTLENKTLTAAKIANGGFLADANGNELLIGTTTASAVNEVTLANAATGNGPSITASGETNVDLTVSAKGTGSLKLKGALFGVKAMAVQVFDGATAVTTGDGKAYIRIPASLNGFNITGVAASVVVKSTSGTPTVQVARGRQANATSDFTYSDVLSTLVTIDENEYDSKDASAAFAINGSNDDLVTGDLLRIDVDVAGTGTKGLNVTIECSLP